MKITNKAYKQYGDYILANKHALVVTEMKLCMDEA